MSQQTNSGNKRGTLYLAIFTFLVIVAAAIAYMELSGFGSDGEGVKIPELSQSAIAGQKLFNKNCSECHGKNGEGSDKGPPLIHDIYNPGHHGDTSFYRAVAEGTMQHHWPFGDMPPQPHVKKSEVADIIAFIREVQSANGIKSKKHMM